MSANTYTDKRGVTLAKSVIERPVRRGYRVPVASLRRQIIRTAQTRSAKKPVTLAGRT